MGKKDNREEPLAVLMAAGTVRGACLLRQGEVIYEKFPYSAARLVKVCRVVEGLTKEFRGQGRSVDQMAFGFEGGNLLAVTVEDYRLIIMHLMSDEIDFLAKSARAYLADFISADTPSKGAVSIDTVPITLAKDREARSGEVEETARVEILTAAPIDGSDEDEDGDVAPGNMSVEDLVGHLASQDSESKD